MSCIKPLRIDIDYDNDARVWYVADTEFPGLVLEDRDAGRLISRLMDAAEDLVMDDRAGVQANPISLLPVFRSSIPVGPKQTVPK